MIQKRTKKETEMLGRMKRRNNIFEELNKNFEIKSIDEEDEETIFEWACFNITNERLFYLMDKKKFDRLGGKT